MSDHATENGKRHAEAIEAAHTAVDWLQTPEHRRDGSDLTDAARALLRDVEWDGEDADAAVEAIEEQMRESALIVTVRSDWTVPGEALEPAEFEILLSTGGPALRIVGPIDWVTLRHGSSHGRMETQDWGTPWRQFFDIEGDALEWFVNLFYFGE